MMTLEDLVNELNNQQALLEEFEDELDSMTADPDSEMTYETKSTSCTNKNSPALPYKCKNPHPHECLAEYTILEGRFVVLWAHFQWPEERAMKTSHNVKRFRMAVDICKGMGNGPSLLQLEVKVDEVTGDLEYNL